MTLKFATGLVAFFSTLLVLSTECSAQGRFLSAVNYAEFRYDSLLTYVEIYTSISPAGLTFHAIENKSEKGRFVTTARLKFKFRNTTNDSVSGIGDEIPIAVADTDSLRGTSGFVGVTKLLFEPGNYEVNAYASCGDSSKIIDSANFVLAVKEYVDSKLSVSDVELCNEISNVTSDKDAYGKNTLHVVPNPKALYGLGMPVLPYYTEIYGLTKSHDTTEFGLRRNVIDTYGRVIKTKVELRSGTSRNPVEVGSVNISDLPTGKYALELQVADSLSHQSTFSNQYFFVYNPYVRPGEVPEGKSIDVLASPFFNMGESALDNTFHAASYLASDDQQNRYRSLKTVDAKRAFLARFWSQQNQLSGPDGPNSWENFEKRYSYANTKYRTAFKDGWLTDRGRVYIQYGAPDDIDRHPNASGNKPYETWTYNSIESGVIFVFVDQTGFNDYVLVHSTKQGEVDDPDWQKYVQSQ
jgi:GWxTD domain-containing protein